MPPSFLKEPGLEPTTSSWANGEEGAVRRHLEILAQPQ
jgi:hypothetical protein